MPDLYPHQQRAVEKLGNGKVLYGGVGSGKSRVAAAYYREHESPKDIVVITTVKKRESRDWETEFALFGVGTNPDLTLHGVIKVDSWHRIINYVDREDCFFIFDEQRLVGTGVWVKAFQNIAKRNNWILLSATPGDTWMDYVPLFVANNLYKSAAEFKREHVVYAPFVKYPKIQRYLDVPTLEKYRNMLLVEMPYSKHTTRLVNNVLVEYDEELFKKVHLERWHIYEDRPLLDVGEMFRVMRKLTSSDQSRVDALCALLEKHPKLVVFYNFDYELEILRGLGEHIPIAEWNGHKKQPIPETQHWLYLVQYTAGAEGWNCTETDAMVFWSMNYSWKIFEQAQGRIDRLDTPFTDLFYYVFTSSSFVDKAIARTLGSKGLFNERAWAAKTGLDQGWPESAEKHAISEEELALMMKHNVPVP